MASQTINLEQIGYQHVACEVNWRGEDDYPKRRIEFLDDKHLLVHFATSDVCNAPPSQWEKHLTQRSSTFLVTLSTPMIGSPATT
jgi:hypothetical protein